MHHSEIIVNKQYLGLNPLDFGYEACRAGHSFGPAVRTYWLLHYVVSGYGVFERNGITHSLKAGDIFVIPPFRKSFYKADDQNPWEYIWVAFTAEDELPELLNEPVIRMAGAGNIFSDMKRCSQMSGGKTAFICSRLWELFSLFWEQESHRTDYAEDAMQLIHSEYMYGITVQDIAHRLNLDRSYFYSVFKEKYGISPQQYLLKHRMEQAAFLMTVGKRSPSLASASVGYSDIYSFSKMFKKVYGVSPRAYIKAQSGNI